MIDRNSPLPIYYQLKMLIKRSIQSRLLQSGDQIPTERALCEQYDISRAPVRQALTELVQEGYIYRRPGQGTFVAQGMEKALLEGASSHQIHFRLLASDMRWVSLLERAIHHWNNLHPDQSVLLDVIQPSPDTFHSTLRAAVVQGNAPDLVSVDYVWVADYARSGYLSALDALDPVWAEHVAVDLESPVAQSHTLNGHLYGLPMQADVGGLWYRRDWFEAEGLAPPQTWDEWLVLLEHFARPDVKARFGYRYPLAFPVSTFTGEATFYFLMPFIWGAGGDLLDEAGNLTLTTPPVYAALRFLQDIVNKRGYLPPESPRFHWWDIPRLLAQGEVPMTLGGTYEWPVICEESDWEGEEELVRRLGFVLAPRRSKAIPPAASLGGTTWVILYQSDVQPLSLNLLKLAIAPEMLDPFCKETLQLSPLRSINQHLTGPEHPWLSQVVPLLQYARPRPNLPQYVRVSRFLQRMLERILWDGASVEETVAHTQSSLQTLLGR